MTPDELSEDFLDAGWGEWDIPDAIDVIETALNYMDENDSI